MLGMGQCELGAEGFYIYMSIYTHIYIYNIYICIYMYIYIYIFHIILCTSHVGAACLTIYLQMRTCVTCAMEIICIILHTIKEPGPGANLLIYPLQWSSKSSDISRCCSCSRATVPWFSPRRGSCQWALCHRLPRWPPGNQRGRTNAKEIQGMFRRLFLHVAWKKMDSFWGHLTQSPASLKLERRVRSTRFSPNFQALHKHNWGQDQILQMHLACIWSGGNQVDLLRPPVVEAGKISKTWDETAKQHCQQEKLLFTSDHPKSPRTFQWSQVVNNFNVIQAFHYLIQTMTPSHQRLRWKPRTAEPQVRKVQSCFSDFPDFCRKMMSSARLCTKVATKALKKSTYISKSCCSFCQTSHNISQVSSCRLRPRAGGRSGRWLLQNGSSWRVSFWNISKHPKMHTYVWIYIYIKLYIYI